MRKRTDDLWFFRDIAIEKQDIRARVIYAALQVGEAVARYRNMMLIALSGVLVLSLYLAAAAGPSGSFLERFFFFLFVFEISALVGVFALVRLGLYLSRIFMMKLYVGIKDAAFFFLPLLGFALYFPLSLISREAWKVHVWLLLLFVLGELWAAFYYATKIAPKKQHDLDISNTIDEDLPVDIEVVSGGFAKRPIDGETRNALTLENGGAASFRLKQKAAGVKLGIGVAEDTVNCGKTLKVAIKLRNGDVSMTVLEKVLDVTANYEERKWMDIALDIDWTGVDFEGHVFEAEVTEYSLSFPGNGFGPSAGHKVYISEPRIVRKKRPRKVIFFVFDAVRHDHVGCYGCKRDVTPFVDAFSKEAVLYRNAIVQGEWTLTSFMSFLTGSYPSEHGVYHPSLYQHLDKRVPAMAEILRDNGFTTRCYFTHKRLVSNFGFARGFDSHIFRQCDKQSRIATGDDVTAYGIDMLDYHKGDDLFLMLHYFDTHQPCNPPSPYTDIYDKTYDRKVVKDIRTSLLGGRDKEFDRRDIDNLIARCDAEVNRLDKRFSAVIEHLKKTGEYDDAMIIFTADHGMPLGDHGDLKNIKLYDEQLRVPLIIKYPAGSGTENGKPVEDIFVETNLDIMPTVLDTCGIKVPDSLGGKSLKAGSGWASPLGKREGFAVSESFFKGTYTVSVRDAKYRYLATAPFDLSSFKSMEFTIKSEEFFRMQEGNPAEVMASGEEERKEAKRYRDIVYAHVEKVKKRCYEGEPE
jgi:arylsulfatase A-like enzyme